MPIRKHQSISGQAFVQTARGCVAWITAVTFIMGTMQADAYSPAGPEAISALGHNAPAQAEQQPPAQLPAVNLSPEGLDELLAPIALYPDPVLAVVLQASVDPQQVMDGGNWLALDQNQNLKEAALDQASSAAGFTPVTQALLHYPTVVDQMCTQFDWTKQLGAAYQADPRAVLASVQRLRAQAVDNGALKSSQQMKVDVKQEQGQQVVQIEPANPQIIYVPQYNPDLVFSQTTVITTPPPTTVVQQQSGVSTGTAVAIGLLSFGAGIALGAAINNNNYYYPAWGRGGVWYGPRPYYPPPYHPVYRGGWHGGYAYNRPVHYGNTNININNNYYNRFNNNRNLSANYHPTTYSRNTNRSNGVYANSMGNRTEYRNNNVRYQPKNVTGNNVGNANWKGQSTYQGRSANANAGNRAANVPTANAGNRAANLPNAGTANLPKAANRTPGSSPATNARGDRGFAAAGGQPRVTANSNSASRPNTNRQPTAQPGNQNAGRAQSNAGGAFSGMNNAKADRSASQRGRASMGAPAMQRSEGSNSRSIGKGRKSQS
ncbi:MAG: DUF3300 domain-containing protein [Acidobacteriaceae bacterium]|nr:DUF3300 domain-containing protein [Acidobacteriaceae bacterium]